MLRSLRSRLIVASVLWTAGLLMLMHIVTLALRHLLPVFRRDRPSGPVAIGIFAMVAGVVVLRLSLTPFRQLKDSLLALRTGGEQRVKGTYPSEVQPLVDDLNALLEDREKAVRRAIATAGDLAHGLKTPLALLAQEAERAGAAGDPELADSITQQVERMSRQMNYHLARARASASGAAGSGRCPVAASANGLVRTVSKLYAERSPEITLAIAPDLCARVQLEDFDEMIGNLLDNACKWAKSKILLEATRSGTGLILTLDDDGPGLDPALRSVVLERGVRIDEAAPGSGLGLAIVRDLAELYGGSVCLESSPLGGLRVRLTLPAC